MNARGFGLLQRTFKKMKTCDSDNSRDCQKPVCSLEETSRREHNARDAEQERVTQCALIQRLQAKENRQPSRTEPPHHGNNEGVRHQGKKSRFKDEWEGRAGIVQTHIDRNQKIEQQCHAETSRS